MRYIGAGGSFGKCLHLDIDALIATPKAQELHDGEADGSLYSTDAVLFHRLGNQHLGGFSKPAEEEIGKRCGLFSREVCCYSEFLVTDIFQDRCLVF